MRGKLDRPGRGRDRKPPFAGGKALQRLFAYHARRDPKLNDDVVATVPAPKSARPRWFLTKRALGLAAVSKAGIRRHHRSAATESFARSVIDASEVLTGAAAPAVEWQSLGPVRIPNGQTYGTNRIDVSGRVSAIAVDPANPAHLLVGAAGGGIWESPDTGATWSPRTDRMPSLAIGAIAFDPANPARVYAGSGEGNFYASLGAGVYTSADGGSTWSIAASSPFAGVGFFQIAVDPSDSATLYGATTSGFFKSTNSGTTWTASRTVRCWGFSVHPGGGAVEILAAFADGLYVSADAGASFAAVTLPDEPSGVWTRLAVDQVKSTPDVGYAFGAAGGKAYLWRRSGGTWASIADLPADMNIEQAWYDWYVAAPPDDVTRVFLGAIDGYLGSLAGNTWSWTDITTQGDNSIHPDQHCLTFSPGNSTILYAGCDGGAFRSADGGATWTPLNAGLVITEIEYLAGDPSTWKWLLAGTQDNGSIIFTGTPVWTHTADGDGGDCGVNQLNPDTIYHSFYNVSLERSLDKGASWTRLHPPAMRSLFYPPVEVFGATVAIGGQSLAVTRTGDDAWTTVPLGLGASEVSTAMREIDANTILIGTNLGQMIRAAWSGTAWKKSVLKSPSGRYISCIAVDPSNPLRVWVTLSQMGGPGVYRSDDGGSSWVNCMANLPGIPMNALVVDPANFQHVWVAADVGVYETLDLGAHWAPLAAGLPNAMVVDLLMHKQDRMLVCATRNRGAWAIPV